MNVKKIKDNLYYYFAEKNWGVRREYGPYVDAHQEEHAKQPWKHWWLLIRLNWHYRILRRTSYYTNQPGRSVSKVKLPYLEGSESKAFARRKAIHLAKSLMSYDVISFDIFDTLILRPFANPTDLFLVVGIQLGIMNFYEIRTQSERAVRERRKSKEKNWEVTIHDIYEEVSRRTGIDIQEGIDAEFTTELKFCFANPYMLQVYKMLKDAGKEIIIVSDMYLPKYMMQQLLESCGYSGYSKLYVSCDYLCSKRTGSLYKIIKRDFYKKSIIHVGDNRVADIDRAQSFGIDAVHYKNCHDIGNMYRADGMSELVGSFYAGIINTHLHNGTKIYSAHYEYGFIYGGLYVLGYCNWIHQKAKQEKIDKILFLSRDGYIYQTIFNMLFDDVANEYIYWSRSITIKSTIELSRTDFLNRVVNQKIHSTMPITIAEMLRSVSLSELMPEFLKNGFREDTLLLPELEDKIKNILVDHWDKIVQIYQADKIQAQNYLKRAVAGCKKVAVIDVGWSGTNVLAVKHLIEAEKTSSYEVKCYIAAYHGAPNYNICEMMSGEIESYMFSRFHNRNLQDSHRNTNKGINGTVFEFFTQANHPSFAGFLKTENFCLRFLRYKIIQSTMRSIEESLIFVLYIQRKQVNFHLCLTFPDMTHICPSAYLPET